MRSCARPRPVLGLRRAPGEPAPSLSQFMSFARDGNPFFHTIFICNFKWSRLASAQRSFQAGFAGARMRRNIGVFRRRCGLHFIGLGRKAKVTMRAAGIVIAALCISVAAISSCQSQEWEWLNDSRVVIVVKDTKVALPSQGSALRDIKFDLSNSKDLKWVIGSPIEARQFFRTSGRILISIPNVPERGDLFLGRFNRTEFQSLKFSIEIGEGSQGNCRAWERAYNQYRTQFDAAPSPADGDGWAEFVSGGSPKTWIYLRIRGALDEPKYFDSFSCGDFGFCSATACIGSDKAFTYQFHRDRQRRENWNALVQKALEVMKFTLIDIDTGGSKSP
jgi:hypothetical protein